MLLDINKFKERGNYMAHFEGEIPTMMYGNCGYSNNGNNGGFGGEWGGLIGLIVAASIFNGNGIFGGGNNRGNAATQADLSAGFANSAMLSNLNDILLQLANGFAGVQQTLCQGFSGINATVNQGVSTLSQGLCTLGYQTQQGFNALGSKIDMCCCDLKQMNLENRYLNEKQTADIIQAINCANQRLVDIYTNDKIDTLNRKLAVAENTISQQQQNAFITANQQAQTAELIRRLGRDCPVPAFIVPNPNCCYNTCGCGGNGFSGFSVQ